MKKPTSVYLNAYVHTRTAQFVETALGDRGTLNGFIAYLEEQAYALFNQDAVPSEPSRVWLDWKAQYTQEVVYVSAGTTETYFEGEIHRNVTDQLPNEIREKYFKNNYADNFDLAKVGLPWDSSYPAWSHLLALFYANDFGVTQKYLEQPLDIEPRLDYSSMEFDSTVTYWSDLDRARQLIEINQLRKQSKFALLERGELIVKPIDDWDRPISLYLNGEQHKFFQTLYSQATLRAIENALFAKFSERPKMLWDTLDTAPSNFRHFVHHRISTESGASGIRYAENPWTSLTAKFLQFKDQIANAEGVSWNTDEIRTVCEQILREDYAEQTRLGSIGGFEEDPEFEDDYEVDEHGFDITRLSPLSFPEKLSELVDRCRNLAILPVAWELAASKDVLDVGSNDSTIFEKLEETLKKQFESSLDGDPRKVFEKIVFDYLDAPEPRYSDAITYHTCQLFALYADSLFETEGISISHLAVLANDGTGADPLGPAQFLELASGLTVRVERDGQHVFYKGKKQVTSFSALQAMRAAAVLGVAIESFNDLAEIGKELRIEIGLPILERAANSEIEGVWDRRGIKRAAEALGLFPKAPTLANRLSDHTKLKLVRSEAQLELFGLLARSPNLSVRIAAIELITEYCFDPRNRSLAILESEDKVYVAVGDAQSLKRLKPAVQRSAKTWEVEELQSMRIGRAIIEQVKDRALWLEVHPAQVELDAKRISI